MVLYQPEIPPNTGNIIRLCANAGVRLHLVGPLAFELDEPRLRRAGLDYRERASVREYPSLAAFRDQVRPRRLLAFSTRGRRCYADMDYVPGDAFLFGSETRGLPQAMLQTLPGERVLQIPLRAGNRSLNLSNAAALVVYEAWRQHGFAGSAARR